MIYWNEHLNLTTPKTRFYIITDVSKWNTCSSQKNPNNVLIEHSEENKFCNPYNFNIIIKERQRGKKIYELELLFLIIRKGETCSSGHCRPLKLYHA